MIRELTKLFEYINSIQNKLYFYIQTSNNQKMKFLQISLTITYKIIKYLGRTKTRIQELYQKLQKILEGN